MTKWNLPRGRLARWRGLIGVAWRRVHHRLGRDGSRQTLVAVIAIALPVALLLLITSVTLGLAADPAAGGDTDYWIVPEGKGSAVIAVDNTRLGDTHATAAELTGRTDVTHASPVLANFISVPDSEESTVRVLAIGIIPGPEHPDIAPLPTDDLEPGDPYFANGTYNGSWTGQAVLSESASRELAIDLRESFSPSGTDRQFTAAAVEPPATAGLSQFPVMIVHLSELQAIIGATSGDTADQLVVVADGSQSTKQALAGAYPSTTVETRGGVASSGGGEQGLPAAMALAALIIALTTGTLLVSTAFGFELAADNRSRQIFSALGIAGRSRAAIVGSELGVIAVYGGGIGVGLWAIGGVVINYITMSRFGAPVASLNLQFIGYGFGVAAVIGVLSLPYLLIISYRAGGEVSLR